VTLLLLLLLLLQVSQMLPVVAGDGMGSVPPDYDVALYL
jgi:hypothetical protein